MPRLVSLLDLELASGTLRLSNLEDGAIPEYLAKLSAPIRLARALPDPFFRLQGARQADVRMSNVAAADAEGKTVSQILAAEELLGRPARARLRDLDSGEDLFDVSGVVAHVSSLTQTDAAFSIEVDDPAALQDVVPKIATIDWFPSAAAAQEHSVIVPFGEMRKAELALLHAGYFDLAFGMVATGGNNYRYDDISNVADYVAAGGDVLVYDVLWLQSGARIALELEASDGTALRSLGAKDQNDHDAAPATALPDALVLNRWYRRRIELPAGLTGKTITRFLVACEQDASGAFGGFIANAYLITAGGAIARTIHNELAPAPILAAYLNANPGQNTLVGTQRAVYDYGPIRTPATGSLSVATVYREGRSVAVAEYSVATPIPGLSLVRFTRAQRDGQGSPMRIQADLVSTEFHQVDPGPIDRGPSPAKVVKFLLEDATYGLGKATAVASFAQAASDYGAAGYKVSGGLDARTPAVDVLRQLLLRGAVLERDSSGAFTLDVDKAERHALAAISLGQGDDRGWQNCEVLADAVPRIEERTKTLVLRGLSDPGFGSTQPTFLLSTSRSRAASGVAKQIDQFFVGDVNVLDRECDYLWKRLQALDRSLRVRADLEARVLAPGDLAAVFVPNLLYAGETLEVRGIGFEGGAAFELALARWDEELFTYVRTIAGRLVREGHLHRDNRRVRALARELERHGEAEFGAARMQRGTAGILDHQHQPVTLLLHSRRYPIADDAAISSQAFESGAE
jgi:hypothetical protein